MASEAPAPFGRVERREAGALLAAVGVAATSGILYELLLGTTASFLLGDSVTEWSLTLGVFLASMGVGSWASRFVRSRILGSLIAVEVIVALVGGYSVLALFGVFAGATHLARLMLYACILVVGGGVGLEVPLLTRALRRYGELRLVLSSVLAIDYGGALLASVLYPFLLYPKLGLARTALFASLFNLLGAILILLAYRREAGLPRRLVAAVGAAFALVVIGLGAATTLTSLIDERLYRPEELVYAERSPYQALALTTHESGEASLYLNGHLQFFTGDEARYHEPLVHVPLGLLEAPRRVLILGGGDGLALREVLRHEAVEAVTLVDLDPMVTDLARRHPLLLKANEGVLADERVEIVNTDALLFLREAGERRFDAILVDLPDPSTPELARLYSVQFYRQVAARLAPGGVAVTQAGSPYFARKAYWCIEAGLRAAGLSTLPYRVNVPSFGEWGFVAASREAKLDPARIRLPREGRFLTTETLPTLFVFPPDLARLEVPPHTLMSPQLPALFEAGWRTHLF
ncbi:MAG: polyamine aminopropyltransferase [Deltaproteobacteria bacterium]|nr:polyamine aminopropyltransferase [Deltaproteobacteria bacterium]